MTVYRTAPSYCHTHRSGERGEGWDVGKVERWIGNEVGEGKEWQIKGAGRVSGEGGWGRGLEERERETEEEK